MASFMGWVHDAEYEKDRQYSREQLLNIHPDMVVGYFTFKAYGMDNPGEHDHPTECRSNTLKRWKSCISSYMPNDWPWNPETMQGNPTKAKAVNELIGKVLLAEVRGLGAESKEVRELEEEELRLLLEILFNGEKPNTRFEPLSPSTST